MSFREKIFHLHKRMLLIIFVSTFLQLWLKILEVYNFFFSTLYLEYCICRNSETRWWFFFQFYYTCYSRNMFLLNTVSRKIRWWNSVHHDVHFFLFFCVIKIKRFFVNCSSLKLKKRNVKKSFFLILLNIKNNKIVTVYCKYN